jgi:hypothetical protein
VIFGSLAGRFGAARTIFVGCLLLAVSYYVMFTHVAIRRRSSLTTR